MLYQIIIYPIELIIEMVYFILIKILGNPGLCIIGVSIAVQILSLPLYNIAEKWQIRERKIQKHLKPQIDRIKAVFKGDEQYMILSTYYRQEHYHPIFAMRSTVSLLIQVPFFIAAYTFLSNLELLVGESFYFIPNLGAPDALFTIDAFSINILPILMTLINILAGVVYTKGFPLKEKIQLYAMSALFLVLLYNSPAGLVLYWTFNNIFSLCKGLVNKTPKPARTFYVLAALSSVGCTLYISIFMSIYWIRELLVVLITISILAIPFFVYFARRVILPQLNQLSINSKQRNKLFACACAGLFLLAGVFIPSALVVSSPQEFSFIGDYTSPLQFLQFPLFQGAGFFLFWLPIVYILFSQSIKNILTWLLVSVFMVALINTFILTGDYGLISVTLQFESELLIIPELGLLIIDGVIVLSCAVIVLLLIKFCSFKITVSVYGLLCASLLFLGCANYVSIQKSYNSLAIMLEKTGNLKQEQSVEPIYNLSKDKQNIVIIMLDRAISSFVPYIFEELPETAKQFDGFTWYPNTLTVSGSTLIAVPPLYGGYEYLPEEINKRVDETLVSKHNEALTMLPRLFLEHGFSSTITDARWANYSWIPDNSIFDAWDIEATNIAGKYTDAWLNAWLNTNAEISEDEEYVVKILKNHFIFFSFFRMFPTSLRGGLYTNGDWWTVDRLHNDYSISFLDTYVHLDYLPELTDFTSLKPSFNFMVNNITHEPVFLQYPDYEFSQNITNIGPNLWNDEWTHKHYHVNAAALKKLGEWFDYLRQNNVYDNTRIIIVSDHGYGLPNLVNATYNPLLMVKDFNMNNPVQTDMTFMVNADVPFLAAENVIENPKNPFTGKPLNTNEKENGINIYTSLAAVPEKHNKNTFIIDSDKIWHVKDNIFIPENWSKVK